MALRILYIHQYFTTPDGASGTRSYEMAKRFVQHGHLTHMLCAPTELSSHPSQHYQVQGIHVHTMRLKKAYTNKDGFFTRLKKFSQFTFFSCVQVFKKRNDYDVVIATSTPLMVGLPGLLAKFFLRKKFIFEIRDQWPELLVAMGVLQNKALIFFATLFEKLIYRSADHIVCLAPGIISNLEKMGINQKKLHFIPNGCDNVVSTQGSTIHLPWNPNQFIAVFCGAHGQANGLQHLLKVAELLKQQHITTIRIVMIGEGSEKDALMALAQSKKLSNCQFLSAMPKKKLLQLIQHADVGILMLEKIPAFAEGTSPNKFFDYLSCGLPVLINHKGWIARELQRVDCGVVAESEDSMANALIAMSQDPATQQQRKAASLALAKQHFDRDKQFEKYKTILESL